MADIKLIDAQGDERTYSGVAKVKIPLADGTGNATFIQPAGKKELTGTNEVDVTNFATAQVVDENLIAENIKSGVSILGVEGTHKGGGETPYYDGTVIIEKAESVLGLRRFKESVTPITRASSTTNEEFFNTYGFEIEPIVIEGTTLSGFSVIWGIISAETGELLLRTTCKVEMNNATSYENLEYPAGLTEIGISEFTVTATANATVDEWLLANTEGVSV